MSTNRERAVLKRMTQLADTLPAYRLAGLLSMLEMEVKRVLIDVRKSTHFVPGHAKERLIASAAGAEYVLHCIEEQVSTIRKFLDKEEYEREERLEKIVGKTLKQYATKKDQP